MDIGQLWTSFYSDEALQTRTLTNWCRPFPIIYSTQWRKPTSYPDRHILCLPFYWIRGTLCISFYSDEALQTRTFTNWCKPFPVIYSTKWRNPIGILIYISLLYQYYVQLDKGQLWTSFYSDEALRTRTLTNWCRPFPIINRTKWRKRIIILIDISSVYPYIG